MNHAPRLVGLGYDGSSSFLSGAALAPPEIRAQLYSPEGNWSSEDLQDLDGQLLDTGDLLLSNAPDEAREQITAGIASILADGARPIALGGDHSVTYPVVQAIHAAHGPVTVLHIDAHPDLYDEFEGDRFSHACPFARIMDERLAAKLVQVGIRAMSRHQREQADRFGVEVIDMRAWDRGDRPSMVSGSIYISIDLDGIDPAFAPGVSHHEPGGLTVRDVIGLVQNVGGTLVGADIVELNPSRDLNNVTARVAAKLVKEVASRMLRA